LLLPPIPLILEPFDDPTFLGGLLFAGDYYLVTCVAPIDADCSTFGIILISSSLLRTIIAPSSSIISGGGLSLDLMPRFGEAIRSSSGS